jgi:hypothetical protein
MSKTEIQEGSEKDIRLKFCSAEDTAILCSVEPPNVTVAQHHDVTIAANVTWFGVRHAPVKTLGTRHTRAVEHPPDRE